MLVATQSIFDGWTHISTIPMAPSLLQEERPHSPLRWWLFYTLFCSIVWPSSICLRVSLLLKPLKSSGKCSDAKLHPCILSFSKDLALPKTASNSCSWRRGTCSTKPYLLDPPFNAFPEIKNGNVQPLFQKLVVLGHLFAFLLPCCDVLKTTENISLSGPALPIRVKHISLLLNVYGTP